MVINNNNTINMTYNALTATNKAIEQTSRALSTGLKAATAADDAAGFAIGIGMSAQLAGISRAIRNSQDGVSLLQTAEAGLGRINEMLQRMRELSVQAANDSLTYQDRSYLQDEIEELCGSINLQATNASFNGKRLLDGTSAAQWSSDNATTKLRVTGVITVTDNYGQKRATEGNYRIEVRANPGQGHVQKSNIINLTVAEEYTYTENAQQAVFEPVNPPAVPDRPEYDIDIENGVSSTGAVSGNGWQFNSGVLTITANGTYSITGTGAATTNRIVISEGVKASLFLKDINIDVSESRYTAALDMTGAEADIFLEGDNILKSGYDVAGILTQANETTGNSSSVTINSASGFGSTDGTLNAICGSGCAAGIGGACHTAGASPSKWTGSVGAITINGGTITATANGPGAGIGGGGFYAGRSGPGANVKVNINGGNVTASSTATGAGIGSGGGSRADFSNVDSITITGGTVTATGNGGGAAIGGGAGGNSGSINISDSARANLTVSGWIDTENGKTEPIGRGQNGLYGGNPVDITKVRIREAKLSEIPSFYDSSSVFMVAQPQTIVITQGDGKKTTVTLYGADTITDAVRKINNAIANDLGQAQYTDNRENFCTIADGTEQTSESVFVQDEPVYQTEYKRDDSGELVLDSSGNPIILNDQGELAGYNAKGTIVVRSAIAGEAGRLSFSSENEDLMKALGLVTIQEPKENLFLASVYDAHSNKVLAKDVPTAGNVITGIIHPNAEIEFDNMANVKATWDEGSKRYVLNSEEDAYTTSLHVKDRSTAFQIGQGRGEDIYINIGDMRAEALGITGVDITTRENASKSIAILDRALHKVNSQRSRLGTYMNELEYNTNSLTNTNLHMQESESRIKDADMALEYMDFVKLQILSQAGNSMLAQANQRSQSVLSMLNLQ